MNRDLLGSSWAVVVNAYEELLMRGIYICPFINGVKEERRFKTSSFTFYFRAFHLHQVMFPTYTYMLP